jgi:hypothetical protein
MKREKIKTPRGTARELRRADMSIFRAERDKRRESENPGTHTFKVAAHGGGRSPERNPHHHSVATVTDMRDGTYVMSQYDYSQDYPANVPSPHRALLSRKVFHTYGAAKEASDEINRITVAEYKPLPKAA